MVDDVDTADSSSYAATLGGAERIRSGVIKVFAEGRAAFEPVAVPEGEPLSIGRGTQCGMRLEDSRASRLHVEVTFSGGAFQVSDRGSHNGSWVDGEWIEGTRAAQHDSVIVVGGTVLLLKRDIQPFLGRGIEVSDGVVIGPRLAAAFRAIRRAARESRVLHVTGETGTGKELAAKLFHQASPRAQRPFVAVNCATIPASLAERLLFGARKGVYSGADANSDGHLASADGGTLFLDEIGELSPEVQAKLLRTVETHEILPLGATRPTKIDLAICSATHESLTARIATGSFRKDLFFRLGRPLVELPPLRDRREEIPWIVQATLAPIPSASVHVSFIAEALMRPWPGNVRELVQAANTAIQDQSGREVRGEHLAKHAGAGLEPIAPQPPLPVETPAAAEERTRVLQALQDARGNVSQAAAELGWHRTQLRRWLERHQIDPRRIVS